MSNRSAIPPYFGPASGWYDPGQCGPGSLIDREGMRQAAIACSVVVLYRRGERIPARELLQREPPAGWLVCMDRYTVPHWYACLFGDEEMRKEVLPRLMHAQLERENGGVRLYGGIEIDRHQEQRQAWLCTPTPARAREILLDLLLQQGAGV